MYGDVILKIQGPHTERYTEIEALRIYDGRRSCRLMAVDLDSAAMLLQRARPGVHLRMLPNRAEQLAIGAEMIATLPVALPPKHGLPSYRQWLERMDRLLAGAPGIQALQLVLRTAGRFFHDMDADSDSPVLLHGDLHHDNILQAGPDRWVAVDPQGVTGAGFLEAGRFIQNHVLWGTGPMDENEVCRTVQVVADRLGQPWDRIAKTLFVLHALSVCWCWESHEEIVELERMCGQCQQIGSMINRY
jgi:streptomycin 6-kinase